MESSVCPRRSAYLDSGVCVYATRHFTIYIRCRHLCQHYVRKLWLNTPLCLRDHSGNRLKLTMLMSHCTRVKMEFGANTGDVPPGHAAAAHGGRPGGAVGVGIHRHAAARRRQGRLLPRPRRLAPWCALRFAVRLASLEFCSFICHHHSTPIYLSLDCPLRPWRYVSFEMPLHSTQNILLQGFL